MELAVEIVRQIFRKRYASEKEIVEPIRLLSQVGMRRTTYKPIGLPMQTEKKVLFCVKRFGHVGAENGVCFPSARLELAATHLMHWRPGSDVLTLV